MVGNIFGQEIGCYDSQGGLDLVPDRTDMNSVIFTKLTNPLLSPGTDLHLGHLFEFKGNSSTP